MYMTQWVTEGDFIVIVTSHMFIKEKFVCIQTILLLYGLTYISHDFLQSVLMLMPSITYAHKPRSVLLFYPVHFVPISCMNWWGTPQNDVHVYKSSEEKVDLFEFV